ncbi:formyltetrahydrofolate deformylase [Pseudaquidulcibacter saccharophilus]|uniref:formyltetrahydrofolate deformylase n=1 Tax=Pseudaquidulcibacter saccharophilus TaxID=2831900 RepID=UPI001EFF536C|nr:formyltetrahydrofolate deformylase [Pseudaquidulcibacter saccharophilus]
MTKRFYTLSLTCPDTVGIVAAVSNFIASHKGWITEAAQYSDESTNTYFMRQQILADSLDIDFETFKAGFAEIAVKFDMKWKLTDSAVKKRVVILVSKLEHCLYDILGRWSSGELDVEIPCVISNHETFRELVEFHKIPFHYVPVTPENKVQAYQKVMDIFEDVKGDVMVLARYMQILSPEMCAKYPGQIINIHHSFLPSFVGAKPYTQAYNKGVKLVGATCHYVTADLDQGPIIEQSVIRIDHSDSPEDMVRYGKDVEKQVFARGLRYHIEDRVLILGNKTVVFR